MRGLYHSPILHTAYFKIFVVARAFFSLRRFFIAAPFLECLRHDFLNCFAFYFSLFDVKLMGEAQAEVGAAKRGRDVAARSKAAARRVVVPAAATAHAARAFSRTRRVGLSD